MFVIFKTVKIVFVLKNSSISKIEMQNDHYEC